VLGSRESQFRRIEERGCFPHADGVGLAMEYAEIEREESGDQREKKRSMLRSYEIVSLGKGAGGGVRPLDDRSRHHADPTSSGRALAPLHRFWKPSRSS
jgi:hypothetical protein